MLNCVTSVLLLAIAVSAAPEGPGPQAESPELVRARERAVAFLLQQLANGKVEEYHGQEGGVPSLAALALLKSGVKPTDDRFAKTLADIRALEPKTTYVVALQTLVLCAAEPKKDVGVIRRNVKWLEETQIRTGFRLGAWGYGQIEQGRGGFGDSSNTQFALLALHEADLAGAAVSDKTWRLALDHWIADQNGDGSWGYYKPMDGMGSDTCAGLISVAVASRRVADKAEREAAQRALQRGQQWLAKHFSVEKNPRPAVNSSDGLWHFYYLRALERAARLTEQSRFGDHDWRKEGVDLLLKSQEDDGSWKDRGHSEDKPAIATSLALLFLTPEPSANPERAWDYKGWLWVTDEAKTYRFAIPAGSTDPNSLGKPFHATKEKTILHRGIFLATTPEGWDLVVKVGQPDPPFKSEADLRRQLAGIGEAIRVGALLGQETLNSKILRRAGGLAVQFTYKSDRSPTNPHLDDPENNGEHRVVVRAVQTAGKEFLFTVAAPKDKYSAERAEQLLDSLSISGKPGDGPNSRPTDERA
jgi:hypothetical protein